ncbi:MAG: glycosyltransferase [Porticoccaceae bacterium]|jgi:glycosyltransferase involved in cell wall biosynthesis|nr:glycosyltransferase [Porticoccaceae bacterium]
MIPKAIHQFYPRFNCGGGITNGMLFIRKLLRNAGIESHIYSAEIPPSLAHDIQPLAAYVDSPDQVLLIHHGSGNAHEEWLENLRARRLMVFHNITPGHFFDPNDPIQLQLQEGWRQLQRWNGWLDGVIADSPVNLQILLDHQYAPLRCRVIPLLVDLDKWRQLKTIPPARPVADEFRLLFVGRLVPHKNQQGLIETLYHLRRMIDCPVSLTLVGAGDVLQEQALLQAVKHLHLADAVTLTGRVSDRELAVIYGQADLYVSLSLHEGFGMPLIEAMAHQLPVVAYNAPNSNIANTIGRAGVLLNSADPVHCAAAIAAVIRQPRLRRRLVIEGNHHLNRFGAKNLAKALFTFLADLGMALSPNEQTELDLTHLDARIEGPWDSSYSLAMVNRELAQALSAAGCGIGLHATEGGGDYIPSVDVANRYPAAAKLAEAAARPHQASSVLRLMYPMRLTAMGGVNHVASCYGWEESALPAATVRQFNYHAHLITTMSTWVARTLIDNGVTTPVVATGIGVDHLLDVQPDQDSLPDLGDGLRFLHISSGFPRKGIDVLLNAYGDAFTGDDQVALVIKTFPNPHQNVIGQLELWRNRHSNPPRVTVIEGDITPGAVRALYERCDVLVAPSRGEGFGLPLAEAMVLNTPVITTGGGGQMDFCSATTAWLIDFDFLPAQTHMAMSDSLWHEPRRDHLSEIMTAFYQAHKEGRWQSFVGERVSAAHKAILSNFTWRRAAERTLRAIQCLDNLPAAPPNPRRGCVTTWNTRCGIAAYSHLLLETALSDCWILANQNAVIIGEDDERVRRCWISGQDDDLQGLLQQIVELKLDQVFIQFNFSLFQINSLGRLLDGLTQRGIQTFLTLHSSADVWWDKDFKTLRQIQPQLAKCTRLLVHGVTDLNRLKGMGLVDNTTLFPHGVMPARKPSLSLTPNHQPFAGKTVIASYGFLLPNKGLPELIEAFAALSDGKEGLHLLLVNSLYPITQSDEEKARCIALLEQWNLTEKSTLITDYLSDEESLRWLQTSSVIVFPYQRSNESSSAAVRWGLATGKPVLCTPLPIFDDVADVVEFTPGTRPDQIAAGISRVLGTPELQQQHKQSQRQTWLDNHNWARLSRRLDGLSKGAAQHALVLGALTAFAEN